MSAAHVMAKGRVVIPAGLRRKYDLREGTLVHFWEEEGRIVMQPVTREYIRSFRGIFRVPRGGKPATKQLLEDRADDLRREEAKLGRPRFSPEAPRRRGKPCHPER